MIILEFQCVYVKKWLIIIFTYLSSGSGSFACGGEGDHFCESPFPAQQEATIFTSNFHSEYWKLKREDSWIHTHTYIYQFDNISKFWSPSFSPRPIFTVIHFRCSIFTLLSFFFALFYFYLFLFFPLAKTRFDAFVIQVLNQMFFFFVRSNN